MNQGYWLDWRGPEPPYDRKTRSLNNLIYCLFRKDILSANSNLRRLFLTRYSPYYRDYTLVFELDGDYNNQDTLCWILLVTTDKILDWCDLTDGCRLDIELITRGRRGIIRNYYEVMWSSFTSRGSFGYREKVDETHPRFDDMCRWIYHNKPREYDSVMNRGYDPYRYRPNEEQQMLQRFRGRGLGQLTHPHPEYDVNRFQIDDEEFRNQVERISQYYNQNNIQTEPIIEDSGFITKLRKKIKI